MAIVNTIMSGVITLYYAVCCHVVMIFFLPRRYFIVNTASSCVIKIHEQYVFFQQFVEVYV